MNSVSQSELDWASGRASRCCLYSPDEGDLLTTAVVTQQLAQYAFSEATGEATEHRSTQLIGWGGAELLIMWVVEGGLRRLNAIGGD